MRLSFVRTALASAAVLLALFGCGGAGEGGGGPSPEARTLRLGEFSWTAARLTNAILEEIVRRHPELGVEAVERVPLEPQAAWDDLERGSLDVLTEVYLPNQKRYADDARAVTELVHRTYAGASNGWFIPRYATLTGAPAEGLARIDQLNRYRDAFGGTLLDGDDGWVTTEQNEQRIRGFGLSLEQATGGEDELVRAISRRYGQARPFLAYLWRPHSLHSAFELVQLREPNPYRPGCFTGHLDACAMPTNEVWTAARTDLATRLPGIERLLRRFEIPLPQVEEMLLKVDIGRAPVERVARDWVDRHARLVERWAGAPGDRS